MLAASAAGRIHRPVWPCVSPWSVISRAILPQSTGASLSARPHAAMTQPNLKLLNMLWQPVEPEQGKRAGDEQEHGGEAGESGPDLGLLGFEDQAGAPVLIDIEGGGL